jgi:hypothetical protein
MQHVKILMKLWLPDSRASDFFLWGGHINAVLPHFADVALRHDVPEIGGSLLYHSAAQSFIAGNSVCAVRASLPDSDPHLQDEIKPL